MHEIRLGDETPSITFEEICEWLENQGLKTVSQPMTGKQIYTNHAGLTVAVINEWTSLK